MTFTITHLTVNGLVHSLSVDTQRPHFGWWLETGENGLLQEAYRILVKQNEKIVWDSGKVLSDQSFEIAYEGEALKPETVYQWIVKVWTPEGDTAEAEDTFETAMLSGSPEAWEGAQWIGNNELALHSETLSVFRMNCTLKLNSEAQKAGFLFGGDDPRLMDRNRNIRDMENKPGESYCAVVLDVSRIPAHVLVYRRRYIKEDKDDVPFVQYEVPETILNENNRYEEHTLYLSCVYGEAEIFLDGEDPAHSLLEPASADFLRNMERLLNLNPMGRGGDFICYPHVGKVGLYEAEGHAEFRKLQIRNYRQPCNVLYEGLPAVNTLTDVSHGAVTMLASRVTAAEKPVRARIYATARGIYELYLNGEKVSEDYLTPGLSQYDRHQYYQVYDVTDRIRQGTNGIGTVLAEGWFSGSISFVGSNWNYFGDRSSFLMKMVLEYADGSRKVFVSDPSCWKKSEEGPVRYASIFQGEVRDMRREVLLQQFTDPAYAIEDWESAEPVVLNETTCYEGETCTKLGSQMPKLDYAKTVYEAQPDESVKVSEVLTAVSMSEPRKGVYIYDMGQNMAGAEEITINGKEGQVVTMRFAEVLYPDLPEYAPYAGTMMMENIRAAYCTDSFTLREGTQVLKPAFTYHGYRYVEITGIDEPLPQDAVRGYSISSLQEASADFRCSDPLITRLYQNISWSLRDNYISIPSDCPQRNERMGWSGDLSVFSRTAVYMSMSAPFLHRHMQAMRDTQRADGRFEDIAPVGGGFGGILWGSAGMSVPWEMYLQYGDRTVLEQMYEPMKKYIAFLKQGKNEQGIVTDGPLGDWLGPENTKNESAYLWMCYYIFDLEILSSSAEILGHPEEAEVYRQEREQAVQDFLRVYTDPLTGESVYSGKEAAMSLNNPFGFGQKDMAPEQTASGRYLIDTQTSYAVPLALHIFTGEQKKRAAAYLNRACTRTTVDDLKETCAPYTLMTGFIGTAWISQALSQNGYDETAWRMLKEKSYPSWLYPVMNGATTIWERLNSYTKENGFGGNNHMNSFNHYSFGAVGTWMLAYAGGVRRSDIPGTFRIAPVPDPDGEVAWADTEVRTVSGIYKVSWKKTEAGYRYSFEIPGGRRTSVELPVSKEQQTEMMQKCREAGAQDLRYERGRVCFTILPGRYDL